MESRKRHGPLGQGNEAHHPPDSRHAEGADNLKVLNVSTNYRKRCFDLETRERPYTFPFALLPHQITAANRVTSVYADPELGNEAFTYELESGETESVHLDSVLYYHADPAYLHDLFLHNLTCEVLKALKKSKLGKRELIRQLGTSASQFYRLLDTANYSKSAGQMISLLHLLGKTVEVTVRPRVDGASGRRRSTTPSKMSPAPKSIS